MGGGQFGDAVALSEQIETLRATIARQEDRLKFIEDVIARLPNIGAVLTPEAYKFWQDHLEREGAGPVSSTVLEDSPTLKIFGDL